MFKRDTALHFPAVMALISLWTASVISFIGSWHYLLELFTHFHIQYLVGFSVLTIYFLARRQPIALTIATLGCLLHSLFLLPYYFQPSVQAENGNPSTVLRTLFVNINYNTTDFSKLRTTVLKYQPDLVGVAELPDNHYQDLSNQLAQYPYHYYVSGRGQLGVALFSRLPFADNPIRWFKEDEQFASLKARMFGQSDQVLEVYLIHPPPPVTNEYAALRNQFFFLLAEEVEQSSIPIVVMGDFNSTSWSPHFQQLLSDDRLIDTRNNHGVEPSWPSQLPQFLRIPIDHLLVTKELKVVYRSVLPSVGSDHLPILADVAW